MTVSNMVTVHMAHQYNVNIAETGIVRAGDRSARIIEKPGAIRIFKYHRPVETAELSIVTTKWCNLHTFR
jgi:hypothetical protein